MPNRVVFTPSAKAGDRFEIAIFAINGPISVAPPNLPKRASSSISNGRTLRGNGFGRVLLIALRRENCLSGNQQPSA